MDKKLFSEKVIMYDNMRLTLTRLGSVLIDTYLNSVVEDLDLHTDTLIATSDTFKAERFGWCQDYIYKREFVL